MPERVAKHGIAIAQSAAAAPSIGLWCRTRHLTWVIVPTRDVDVRLVADFVRQLRRVALHPVALDDPVGEETPMPGDLLRKLMSVETTVTVRSDKTATSRRSRRTRPAA